MHANSRLQVLPVGMDERYEAACRVVFSRPEIGMDFSSLNPQLLLVDLTSPSGYLAWEIARKAHAEAKVLVLAYAHLNVGDACVLKPFDPIKLYETAKSLCASNTSHAEVVALENDSLTNNQHASDIKSERRRRVRKWGEETHYNPQSHLQYYWEQAAVRAIKSNSYIAVLGLPFEILFDGSTKTVYIDKTDQALKLFCLALVRKDRIALRQVSSIQPYLTLPSQSMESFLWKTAIWTARGRLPSGCDPYEVVRLKRWPNLTRLFKIPHAPRLAAIWSSRPVSPLQMVKSAEAAPQEVFDFYSGCKTLGLIQKMSLAASPPLQHVEQNPQKARKPILSWILNKIRETF